MATQDRAPDVPQLVRDALVLPVRAVPLFVAVFLVALNLRAAIAAVPPLTGTIEAELGISGAVMGAVIALPVLCMGLFAPLSARLAHRVGRERAVALALCSLVLGQSVRLGGDRFAVLLLGTLLAGIGIAVCGTVLPGIVKEYFGGRTGLTTGVYMFSMTLGGSTASAVSVPLATAFGGWTRSLAAWSLLAVVGLGVWLPVVRSAGRRNYSGAEAQGAAAVDPTRQGLPWRSPTAWLLSVYLLIGSWQFYSHLAWLPSAYVARGWTTTSAGLLLAVYQLAQLVTGLGGPALTDHVADRRRLMWPGIGSMLVALLGLTLAPDAAPWLWAVMLGFGMGMAFAVGLVLLVDYVGTPTDAARLSAMVFLLSYSLAAVGPTTFGALRDLTGGFTTSWSVLIVLAVVHLVLVTPLRPGRGVVRD